MIKTGGGDGYVTAVLYQLYIKEMRRADIIYVPHYCQSSDMLGSMLTAFPRTSLAGSLCFCEPDHSFFAEWLSVRYLSFSSTWPINQWVSMTAISIQHLIPPPSSVGLLINYTSASL